VNCSVVFGSRGRPCSAWNFVKQEDSATSPQLCLEGDLIKSDWADLNLEGKLRRMAAGSFTCFTTEWRANESAISDRWRNWAGRGLREECSRKETL